MRLHRRYTLDEVKRRVVDILQDASTGLSGLEIADRTGINRMTVTKYLTILQAMGLIKKKAVGSVNVWFLEAGVAGIEFPIDYLQVQQKLVNAALAGEQDQARRILINVANSSVDHVKIFSEIIIPAVSTISETYNRGRLSKTERIVLMNMMSDLIDLVKFNIQSPELKPHAHAISVVGTEDRIHFAKSISAALQTIGWDSRYIGNVEEHIDPFFDIDFQRYISKIWANKRGLMLICILSSGEGSLRFLASTAKAMRGRLKGELRLAVWTNSDLQPLAEEEGTDYLIKDLQSFVDWAQREYKVVVAKT